VRFEKNCRWRPSIRLSGLKSIASACRRYLQMKRCMARVGTIVDQSLGGLMAHANLNQLGIARMRFAEMNTQTTLAIV
jgi:hypothetical protein